MCEFCEEQKIIEFFDGKLHGISEKKEKVMTRTMQIARLGNLE